MIRAFRVIVEGWINDEGLPTPPDPIMETNTYIEKLVGQQFTITKAHIETGTGQGGRDIAGNITFKMAEFQDVTPALPPPPSP